MAYKYKEYEESDAVKQAKANLDAQLAKKPGAYTSQWQAQLDDVLGKIQNREKFSYNVNGDALYQNYKDRFVQQGQQAMQDTMGQAAALTGGYGSSYSQNAGQQAYHGYLQGLNDVVPELYQIALDRYNQEGENMLNMYGILGDKEAQDYGRWQDALGAYERERDYLAGLYDAERGYDYGRYSDDRDLAYSQYRDQVADEQWEKQFAYAKERDKIADEQWAKQFAASQAARNSGGGPAPKPLEPKLGFSATPMGERQFDQLGMNLAHAVQNMGMKAAAKILERNIPNLTLEQFNHWADMLDNWSKEN